MVKCGIYLRKSRSIEEEGKLSIEGREDLGREFCVDNGYECVVYNEGIIGSDDSRREMIYKLLDDV